RIEAVYLSNSPRSTLSDAFCERCHAVRLLRKPSIFPTCVKVGIPAQGLSRHHLWRRWAECACIVSGKVGVEVKPDTSFSEACPQRQSRVPLVIKIYKVNPCNIGDWAQVA